MTHPDTPVERSRRRFLSRAAAGGVALAASGLSRFTPAEAQASDEFYWFDPAAWPDGKVPGSSDVAVVDRKVLLVGAAEVAGVEIRPMGRLRFLPSSFYGTRIHSIRSTGNVVVEGELQMRPGAATIDHSIVFVDVDEAAFVGEGLNPIASDVGLWAVGDGVLNAAGTAKRGWTRLAYDATAGQEQVTCTDITGWLVGDEVVVAPTARPSGINDSTWNTGVEQRTITAILRAGIINLDAPLAFDHRMVDGRFGAEVVNLTRNVRIEGTPGGRSHVFIRSTRPNPLSHLALTHMGPRKLNPNSGEVEKIVGRWPLHYHHNHESQRGIVVAGVVATKAGSHAFVPHLTHGVTLRDCVAYDVTEHAYWWDDPATDNEVTKDSLWEDCLAMLIHPPSNGDVSGFYLGKGVANITEPTTNVIRGCVAVASEEAGFNNPAACCGSAWMVEDVLAHNNRKMGWKTYTNQGDIRPIGKITAYHNQHGIGHGAYLNAFRFQDSELVGNQEAGILLQALSTDAGLRYTGGTIDQQGLYPAGITAGNHSRGSLHPTVVENYTIGGCTKAAIVFDRFESDPDKADRLDVLDTTIEGNALWLGTVNPATIVRFRGGTIGNLDARPNETPGSVFRPEWNAWVTPA